MRVLLSTIETRGDVQPLAAVALQLNHYWLVVAARVLVLRGLRALAVRF